MAEFIEARFFMSHQTAFQMNALIVDPSSESRSRLRQALHHEEKSGLLRFHTIKAAASTGEALVMLGTNPDIDLILIAYSVGKDEINKFISNSAALRTDRFTYIIVLKPEMQRKLTIVQNLIDGAHGMLCEPYSLESLKDIAEIAQRVRKLNEERRMLAGLPLLAELMLKEIDTAAEKLRGGIKKKPLSSKYRSVVTQLFEKFPEASPTAYFDALISATEKALPRKPPKYQGPSEILKKKYGPEQEAEDQGKKRSDQKIVIIHR